MARARDSESGLPTPTLRREPLQVRLPRWMIDWLDTREESRAELVEEALKARHRLKGP